MTLSNPRQRKVNQGGNMTLAQNDDTGTQYQRSPADMFCQIGVQQLISMFDLMPDTLFWIKDRNSRMLHVNAPLQQHLGITDAQQVVGMSDFDFAPKHIAKKFVSDDEKISFWVDLIRNRGK